MRTVVIVNKRAGCGVRNSVIARLRQRAGEVGARWLAARSRAETSCAASEAAAEGVDVVVAVGGDGTVNAVGERLVGTQTALAIVPVGSANDLARECGIAQDPLAAFTTALSGVPRSVDVIRVNGRHFFTCGGAGLPSTVIAEINGRRDRSRLFRALGRHGGSLCYAAVAARQLLFEGTCEVPFELVVDGQTISLRTNALVLANQPRFGRWFTIAPSAENTDGVLNICALGGSGSRLRLMRNVFRSVRGVHELRPGVVTFRVRHTALRFESAVDWFGDGELLLRDTCFDVSVVPSALRIVCPATEPAAADPNRRTLVSSCRSAHSWYAR